jgi:hypothetical protein
MKSPVFPAPFAEETIFSPTRILDFFLKNQMAIVVWVCVRVFYCITLVFMSVFAPVSFYFYYLALLNGLKSGIVIPSVLLFWLRIALGI